MPCTLEEAPGCGQQKKQLALSCSDLRADTIASPSQASVVEITLHVLQLQIVRISTKRLVNLVGNVEQGPVSSSDAESSQSSLNSNLGWAVVSGGCVSETASVSCGLQLLDCE